MTWDNSKQKWVSIVRSTRPPGRAPKGKNGKSMVWSNEKNKFVENRIK